MLFLESQTHHTLPGATNPVLPESVMGFSQSHRHSEKYRYGNESSYIL